MQMNAEANSAVDNSIERGLNNLTGGASRAILLSPEFTRALNAIDGFFAGVADALTAGLSTHLRTAMWGETATQNHTGGWFLLGQGVGFVLSIPLMAANPCSLGLIGNIGLRVINGVQLIGNGITAIENIMAGNYLAAGLNVLGMLGNLSSMSRACFTGEMQVKTGRGWVRWDQLSEHDEVLSGNEHDPHGELAYKPMYVAGGNKHGRELVLDVYELPLRQRGTIEGQLRRLFGSAPALPWDNAGLRLGRPGPGIPPAP